MVYTHPGTILVVDDEQQNVIVFTRLMTHLGYVVKSAANGAEALEIVARDPPDLILLDVDMPVLNGIEVCRRIKGDPNTRLIPIIVVTALSARADRIRGIEAGADDFIAKPPDFDELAARVRSLVRLKRYTDELDSAESVILSLALTIEARDPYTHGHCLRLAAFATAVGHHLGLDDDACFSLYQGGFLHDVGKIGVPDDILLKPGPLLADEWDKMRQHPVIGDNLCKGLRSLHGVRPIIRHHHEYLDGSGYPDGLRGDEVPLLAQIMGVVDAYDAITTDRPYKRARDPRAAIDELRLDVTRGHRSGKLVDAFVELSQEGTERLLARAGERPLQNWRS